MEESVKAVKGAVHELVDEHLARAAAYDSMWGMVDEIIRDETPQIVSSYRLYILFHFPCEFLIDFFSKSYYMLSGILQVYFNL